MASRSPISGRITPSRSKRWQYQPNGMTGAIAQNCGAGDRSGHDPSPARWTGQDGVGGVLPGSLLPVVVTPGSS